MNKLCVCSVGCRCQDNAYNNLLSGCLSLQIGLQPVKKKKKKKRKASVVTLNYSVVIKMCGSNGIPSLALNSLPHPKPNTM